MAWSPPGRGQRESHSNCRLGRQRIVIAVFTLLVYTLGGSNHVNNPHPPLPVAFLPPEPENSAVKTKTFAQIQALGKLRKSATVDQTWKAFEQADVNHAEVSKLPAEFVDKFIANPNLYTSDFLKGFLGFAKLDPISVPANSYGLVKSPKWYRKEKELLVTTIREFQQAGSDQSALFHKYIQEAGEQIDPDHDDSQDDMRNEMAMRNTLGRRKTALESWIDAQSGVPPSTDL